MIAEISVFSVSFWILTAMRPMYCHQGGRLFQSFGPSEANERSPTVTRRDGLTSSCWKSPAVDDEEMASQQRCEGRTGIEVQCRAELGIQGPPAI